MASTSTLTEILVNVVYEQLQDKEGMVRWTRDELTEYVNAALRDAVARRPEAGVITDHALPLASGKRQQLPETAIRLKEIVRNIPGLFGTIATDQVGQQILAAVGIAGIAGSVSTEQAAQVVAIVANAIAQLGAEIETYQYPQIPDVEATATSRYTYTPTYAAYTKETDGLAYRARVALYDAVTDARRLDLHNVTGLTTGQADISSALLTGSRVFTNEGTEVVFDTHAGTGAVGRVKRFDLLALADAGGSAAITEASYTGELAVSEDGTYIVVAARDTTAHSYYVKVNLFDAATLSLIGTANSVGAIQHVVGMNYPFALGGAWTRPMARIRPHISRDKSMVFAAGFACENWTEDVGGGGGGLMRFLFWHPSSGYTTSGIQRWSIPAMTLLTEPVVRASGYEIGATELAPIPGEDVVLAVGRNFYLTWPLGGEYFGQQLPQQPMYFTVYDVVGTNLFQRSIRVALPAIHDLEGAIAQNKRGQWGRSRERTMHVSPNGAWCVVTTDRASPWMTIINLSNFTVVTALSGGNIPAGVITDCLYSGNGTQFLISTGSNVYSVYDTSTWTVAGTVTFPTGTKWVVPYGVDTFTLD